ncbi:hypothetical protein NBE98_02210 [Clostridium swellfunianum]|uniref:hypothetical protein n=1 Tax=Clostridium swellfunianum TaxID=1367462 RepID=UPI0020303F1A|nr:hypothetical protein [Clostridium swellfunianum]MCM0647186.1 hypothetical protein [Clostridium swellfunianum]
MSAELKILVSKLSRETQIPYKSLLLAVRKTIISGRMSKHELISVLRKMTD